MAITLEGIVLPDLIIDNEVYWPGVRCEMDRTLEGGLIIYEKEMIGKPIDLVGRTDTAWIKKKTLFDVYDLAKVPNAVYVLDYEGVVSNVRFRHEEGDVVSAIPIVERPNSSDNDWYSNVIIKLMEV